MVSWHPPHLSLSTETAESPYTHCYYPLTHQNSIVFQSSCQKSDQILEPNHSSFLPGLANRIWPRQERNLKCLALPVIQSCPPQPA
ncbi:hypothetical protein OIU78_009985 [Salix suchowensis]|nr:hypothetical protein OIU78_009985 [Salix suchowensis]